ncbi:MAG: manganese catalase family protein [Peptococcaceae bacterium]|nr:manganese catalase family protein [Peptococcaceae bacterium]
MFSPDANGVPWTALWIGVTGDPIADLNDDLADSN